jgi:lantibiotic modifying enzyme
MEQLTMDELDRQLDLIRLAFLAKLADPHTEGKLELQDVKANIVSPVCEREVVHQKESIRWFADTLMNSILDDRYGHLPKTWIGPVVRYGNPGWNPGVLGYDLYAGRVGIALALTAAGKALNDEKAIAVASEVFERSAQILNAKTYELRNVLMSGIGAFSGVSGLLWSLCAASEITGNKRWKELAVSSWSLLPNLFLVNESEFFDMIMGSSGAIIMRLRTQLDWRIEDEYMNKCISLVYAKISSNDPKTTSGLAHGYGHLIWFFSCVAQRQPSKEITDIVHEIYALIQTKYTANNGFIQTSVGAIDQVSFSWCNGLSGLLIAYYEAYKANILPQDSVINIIEQIKRIPLSNLPILCHGSLGILEALQYAGQSFPDQTADIIAKLEKLFCSSQYIVDYFKHGKGRYPLSPGLMVGKAGALLHLCRSVDPSIKASPLTFGN